MVRTSCYPSIRMSCSGCGFRNGEESYFMLERDRGEMPVHRRKSKDQTYYAKKMLAYHEANRVGEHVQELGLRSFRVLTVRQRPRLGSSR